MLVVDTHVIVWLLSKPEKLSKNAMDRIMGEFEDGRALLVSAISLVDLCYLIEKSKIPQEVWSEIHEAVGRGELVILPLGPDEVTALPRVPRSEVPDMPDRIIAAPALALGLELVTADERLRAFEGISTFW